VPFCKILSSLGREKGPENSGLVTVLVRFKHCAEFAEQSQQGRGEAKGAKAFSPLADGKHRGGGDWPRFAESIDAE
jgi:hypothetical protein